MVVVVRVGRKEKQKMTKVTDGNLTDSLKYLTIIACIVLIAIGGSLILFAFIIFPILKILISYILKYIGIEVVI